MKNLSVLPIRLPKNFKFGLLGVVAVLIAINLNLILRRVEEPGNINLLGTSVLSWAALLLLLWRQRDTLGGEKDIFSILSGIALITLVLFATPFLYDYVPFIRVIPLISALAVFLVAFSARGLKQYFQELCLFCILALPERAIGALASLPSVTAKFAYLVLSQLGLDVSLQGTYVILPTGAIDVDHGCSGANVMIQLFRLALLFLVLFPTKLNKKMWVQFSLPLVAALLAFLVNGFRVALLAMLVASFDLKAFDYWHTGEGSHIFSMTSVLIFGSICYCLMSADELQDAG